MFRTASHRTRVVHRVSLPAIALLLGGCLASLRPRAAPPAHLTFDPTQFFAGHTRGEGTFDFRFGADRTLRVAGFGRMLNADGLTVHNQAQVTVLGIPWARLSETITREDAPSR